MNRLLKFFFSVIATFAFVVSYGQQITHLSGTQNVNGINVTVVPNGVAQVSTFCNGGPYWIGNSFGVSPGSYTFKFATPVTGVKLILQAVNATEINCITINGSPYAITPANFSPLSNNCGFQTVSILQAGCITEFVNSNVSGCELDIDYCSGIDSITIENNGLVSGTVFSIQYKNDIIPALAVSSNSPVCIASPIQLTMTTPYILGADYNWNGPNGYTFNPVNPNVSIPNAQLVNAGTYSLTVSTVCTTATVSVNVAVLPPPTISSVNIFHPTSCNGNDGAIVLYGLSPNTTYVVNYSYNSTPQAPVSLTTDAGGALIISGLQAGIYTNIIVGSGNCATAPSGPYTLNNGPFSIAGTSTDATVCNANDGSITISGVNPGATYNIDYSYNGTSQLTLSFTANSSGLIVIPNLLPGVYDNIVLSIGACVSTTIGPFTINNPPLLLSSAGSNSPLCEGGTLQLNAALITGGTYSWTGPAGFTSAAQNPSINAVTTTESGTYSVVASLNGCNSNLIDVIVVVNPVPLAPLTEDVTYCVNGTANALTANGQNLLWYTAATGGSGAQSIVPSTSTAGGITYYVSQTINGCESNRAPLTVAILPALNVNLTVSRDTICINDTVTVSNAIAGGPGLQYSWTTDGGNVISGQDNDAHVISWDSYGTKSVSLTISDSFCTASGSVSIQVDTPVAPYFEMNANACINEAVIIDNVVYSGSNPQVYYWSFDGADVISGQGKGPYTVRWADEGTKLVEVVVKGICNDVYSSSIDVHIPPVARIESITEGTICQGTPITLSAYKDDKAYIYKWRNIDYDHYNDAVISGNVKEAGYVTLKTIDKYGCSSEDSIYVDVQPCCQLFIPSVFSPNGDGKNDIFIPHSTGVDHYTTFQVMNRFGQKVFESRNNITGWDGTFNGMPQDIGTYQYFLNYYCSDKLIQKKGDVTLVR
jgi:gliding motility-associated-like protein